MDDRLEELVQDILASPKYRTISSDLVREVGRRELARRPSFKTAVKATRNTLHQAGGAFSDGLLPLERGLQLLQEAAEADQPNVPGPAWREAAREVMGWHTSSRERLPILDEFFAQTLASLPPPATVLDVASGLNPLARPWMPIPTSTRYLAYDIFSDVSSFLNAAMATTEYPVLASVRDVVGSPPDETAELAMVLKTLPCLEKIDKSAPGRLLDAIPARYLLVSFPAQSLGGRRKGMVSHYEEQFGKLLAQRKWDAERFEFSTELAFLVEKH